MQFFADTALSGKIEVPGKGGETAILKNLILRR